MTSSSGFLVPSFGWSPGQLRGKELERELTAVIAAGCQFIESDFNNEDEEEIGMALESVLQRSGVQRDNILVAAKLPFIGNDPRRVEYFARKSLKNLRVDCIDLYLISGPIGFEYTNDSTVIPRVEGGDKVLLDLTTDVTAVWKAMETLVDLAIVRAIGVCHFNIPQLKQVFRFARIPPAVLQVECHPFFQQMALMDFCGEYGVQLVALHPFGVPPVENLSSPSSVKLRPHPLQNSVIKKFALRNWIPSKVVILKFHRARKVPVIVDGSEASNLSSQQQSNWRLSTEDMEALRKLDRGFSGRMFHFCEIFPGSESHCEYPFHESPSARKPLTADIVYPDRYAFN